MAQYNRNLVAPNNINLEGYNNKACLFCLQPVTNQTILECCGRSSHINCAHTCRESSTQRRPIFKCPNCLYHKPLKVLEINPIQSWKEDERFAAQVMAIWKDNPLWFARSHTIEMPVKEGCWGRLLNVFGHYHYAIYFLGRTKNEVILNMRACLTQRLNPMRPPPCSRSDWKY